MKPKGQQAPKEMLEFVSNSEVKVKITANCHFPLIRLAKN